MRAYVRERAYVRYTRILIIFQTCQDISHWTYLKMTEISYVLADILNILGYHDLFSDLSIRIKVPDRPLKCIFASNSGWVRVRCLCLTRQPPIVLRLSRELCGIRVLSWLFHGRGSPGEFKLPGAAVANLKRRQRRPAGGLHGPVYLFCARESNTTKVGVLGGRSSP